MSWRAIAQCDKDLDFKPRRAWPAALPAFAWQNQLLTGFERVEGNALDLSARGGCSLREVFRSCYSDLQLAELARLVQRWQQWQNSQRQPTLEATELAQLTEGSGWGWSERLRTTLAYIVETPAAFQNWIDDKKVGPRDLSPLLAVETEKLPALYPFLEKVVELPLSKMEGCQALEWGVELWLLGKPLAELLPSPASSSAETDKRQAESYLKRLRSLRLPVSMASDEEWRKRVVQFPWPSRVHGTWARWGDQTGLEIRLRAHSPGELTTQIEKLRAVSAAWSISPEDLDREI
jgi:hypothetical protein